MVFRRKPILILSAAWAGRTVRANGTASRDNTSKDDKPPRMSLRRKLMMLFSPHHFCSAFGGLANEGYLLRCGGTVNPPGQPASFRLRRRHHIGLGEGFHRGRDLL